MTPPIHSLILIGGKSSRMGQDKAQLTLDSQSLLDRSIATLSEITPEQVHLSISYEDSRSYSLPTIADLEPSPGPLGGLAAAFTKNPNAAWLVLRSISLESMPLNCNTSFSTGTLKKTRPVFSTRSINNLSHSALFSSPAPLPNSKRPSHKIPDVHGSFSAR